MFPELRERLKRWLPDLGGKPLSLDLKTAGGISFDAVNLGWYALNGFAGIYSILSGGMPAWSGEPVSVETALNHSVVWACNRLISESTGFLPLVMLQQKNGRKDVALKHPMYRALHDAPSDEMTALSFRSTLTSHCLLQGNAFAQIIRRSGTGTAIELHPLHPNQVMPDREKAGAKRLIYVVKDGNSPEKTYTLVKGKPQDILHLRGLGDDGIRGFSVITMARQSIGTSIAVERNIARYYAMGGRLPYILEMPQKFKTNEDFDKFRTDWEKTYQEPHKAPILEGGMTYKQIGINAKDSQLIDTRMFDIHEICRWFNVSPHLVGDLTRATFSNIEQLAMEFVKMTLGIHITRWEQECWRCILTDEEKNEGYFWRHNVDALLRGDFASRVAGYASSLQNGWMNRDEVRDKEDLNPIPNGAGTGYTIQLNLAPIPGSSDNITTADEQALASGGIRGLVPGETKGADIMDSLFSFAGRLTQIEKAQQDLVQAVDAIAFDGGRRQQQPVINIAMPKQDAPRVDISSPVTVRVPAPLTRKTHKVNRNSVGLIESVETLEEVASLREK